MGDPTVTVTIANGVVVAGTHNTTTTVDLSSLPDDASITSTLALDSDAAGNSFTTVSGTDGDAGPGCGRAGGAGRVGE